MNKDDAHTDPEPEDAMVIPQNADASLSLDELLHQLRGQMLDLKKQKIERVKADILNFKWRRGIRGYRG